MYQIEGTYQVEDYQQAMKLHSFPKRIMGVSFHVFWPIVFGCNILLLGYFSLFVGGWLLYKNILQVVVIIMLVFSMIYYLYMPYRVRKVFAQQKELHLPLKMEFSEEGIRFENANSQGIRNWDVFLKWKENQNMTMLYLSDVMFMMLPRRMLTQEIISFLHEQLRKNKIPEK